jgi:serine/threonine-protein kinase RsbW
MTMPPTVHLVLPQVHDAELLAGRAVYDVGQGLGFAHDTLEEVKLAVVEACLNALEHGHGEVEVEVIAHPDAAAPYIEILVVDHGPGFDPTCVPPPSLERKLRGNRKRGWGLELMRHLMDEVEVSSSPGLTQVRLVRRREGAGSGHV